MNREDSTGLIRTEQQELEDLKKRFALLGKACSLYKQRVNGLLSIKHPSILSNAIASKFSCFRARTKSSETRSKLR